MGWWVKIVFICVTSFMDEPLMNELTQQARNLDCGKVTQNKILPDLEYFFLQMFFHSESTGTSGLCYVCVLDNCQAYCEEEQLLHTV